jgi:hypothetical protein
LWKKIKEVHIAFNAVVPYIDITDESERNRQIEETLKEEPERMIFSAKNQEALEEKFGEELERLTGFAGNLIECIAGRGNNPFAAFNETNIKRGILAWDLGRLVIVARMRYDVGYIDEKTAWGIITDAYETAKKNLKIGMKRLFYI